jgi:hypothetical protein
MYKHPLDYNPHWICQECEASEAGECEDHAEWFRIIDEINHYQHMGWPLEPTAQELSEHTDWLALIGDEEGR